MSNNLSNINYNNLFVGRPKGWSSAYSTDISGSIYCSYGGIIAPNGGTINIGTLQSTANANYTGSPNITYSGNYCFYTYKSSGTFIPPQNMQVGIIVVGGGGGGGNTSTSYAGGGAGGGVSYVPITNGLNLVANNTYTITVGAGGAGGGLGDNNGSDGGTSSVTGTISSGSMNITATGGTGGIGGHSNTYLTQSCPNGGIGKTSSNVSGFSYTGGNSSMVAGSFYTVAGNGQSFTDSSTGITYQFGGGGGDGAGGAPGAGGGAAGAAGGNGAGSGSYSAAANTGGGGGGARWQNNNTIPGGNGGSGVVIIYFSNQFVINGSLYSYGTNILAASGGYVGIGTNSPTYPLEVIANGSATSNYIYPRSINQNGNQYDYFYILKLGQTSGGQFVIALDGGAAGMNSNIYFLANTTDDAFYRYKLNQVAFIENDTAQVKVINFTGQHRCAFDDNINSKSCEGLIVNSTGKYWSMIDNYNNTSQIDHITIDESLPTITLTSHANCKSVIGVISYTEDQNNTRKFNGAGRFISVWQNPLGEKNRVYINSIGEGGIWVCNANGAFTNGDFITSSNVPGYGMCQDSDDMENYTVGKITTDCDFNPIQLPVIKLITDSSGNLISINEIVTDESGNIITKPAYKIRYLKPDGTIITKDEYDTLLSDEKLAYIAAFVGCTYHCG